jgi:hypothetical protein
VHVDEPRADPTVIDLIELAGLWLAAHDWVALSRTLQRLDHELGRRFARDVEFRERFRELQALVDQRDPSRPVDPDLIRRTYRRATLG